MPDIITKSVLTGDGTTKNYTIPFDYLSRSHVHVTVDGEVQDYEYTNAKAIAFASPPPKGSVIIIERQTPYDEPWISWSDGTVMIANDLNAQQLQSLFVLQENKMVSEEAKSYRDETLAIKNDITKTAAAAEIARANAEQAAEYAQFASASAADSRDAALAAKEAVLSVSSVLPWEETKSYSYPDMACCPDGNTYRCIGENITGEYPPESEMWVRITVIQAAGNYDMESGGTFADAAASAVSGGQL